MTDRSKLLALAEAVEKLPGPDRGMDAEIAACLRVGTEHPWALNYPSWIATANGRVHLEKNGPSFASPLYTASIDAAMTLVPDDECWPVGHDADDPSGFAAQCSYTPEPGHMGFVIGRGATAALALTAAALSARGHAQAEALA